MCLKITMVASALTQRKSHQRPYYIVFQLCFFVLSRTDNHRILKSSVSWMGYGHAIHAGKGRNKKRTLFASLYTKYCTHSPCMLSDTTNEQWRQSSLRSSTPFPCPSLSFLPLFPISCLPHPLLFPCPFLPFPDLFSQLEVWGAS